MRINGGIKTTKSENTELRVILQSLEKLHQKIDHQALELKHLSQKVDNLLSKKVKSYDPDLLLKLGSQLDTLLSDIQFNSKARQMAEENLLKEV